MWSDRLSVRLGLWPQGFNVREAGDAARLRKFVRLADENRRLDHKRLG
jgi:hypothetical protein